MEMKFFIFEICVLVMFLSSASGQRVLCDFCSCESSHIFCVDDINISLLNTYSGSRITSVVIIGVNSGTLSENDFSKITEISDLQMESNNFHIEDNAFNSLLNLINLNLRNNNIQEITASMLRMNNKLKNLDLSENRIQHVKDGVFSYMKRLMSLNLSNNNISTIETNAFAELRSLRELDLSGNRLQHMDALTFAPLNALKELRVERNRVTSFSPALVELLAQRPGLSAQLQPNPLRCACGELRAAWAAAAARGLHLRLTCESGQPWDDVMRSLVCEKEATQSPTVRAERELTTRSNIMATTPMKAVHDTQRGYPVLEPSAQLAPGDPRKDEVLSELGKWDGENTSVEFIVLLCLICLLAAITTCVVSTLLVFHIRVKKAAKAYATLVSNQSQSGFGQQTALTRLE